MAKNSCRPGRKIIDGVCYYVIKLKSCLVVGVLLCNTPRFFGDSLNLWLGDFRSEQIHE